MKYKNLRITVFCVACISNVVCLAQPTEIECYRFEITQIHRPDVKFGEAYYEINGPRFVYLYDIEENEPICTAAKAAFGFDGNEFWIASFSDGTYPFVNEESASSVARFADKSSMKKQFTRDERSYFGFSTGQLYFEKMALIELVLDRTKLKHTRIGIAELEATLKDNGEVNIVQSKSDVEYSAFKDSRYFKTGKLIVEGLAKKSESQNWSFLAQFDEDTQNSLAKLYMVDKSYPRTQLGGGMPAWLGPLLPLLEVTRKEKMSISQLYFLPQYYVNGKTKLVTFGDSAKEERGR